MYQQIRDVSYLQFKRFHRDVIIELEKKTEMDVKYMNVRVSLEKTAFFCLLRDRHGDPDINKYF